MGSAFNIGKPSLSRMAGKAANFLGTSHQAEKKQETPNEPLVDAQARQRDVRNPPGFDLQTNDTDLIDLDSNQLTYTADFRQQ